MAALYEVPLQLAVSFNEGSGRTCMNTSEVSLH